MNSSSIGLSPNTFVLPNGNLVFAHQVDGKMARYTGAQCAYLEGLGTIQNSSERYYVLHYLNKETPNLQKIVEIGNIAVLIIQNGSLAALLFHPAIEFKLNLNGFILCTKPNSEPALLNKVVLNKLDVDQCVKISQKLLA